MKYRQIQTKENYMLLLKSGMFWEFHPELTGEWDKDKNLISGDTGDFRDNCESQQDYYGYE